MIHNVDAIYDNGVFRLMEPLPLPDGARVHLHVDDEDGRFAETSKRTADYRAWLESLAGRWHGDFLRGNEGTFETREPLS